MPSQDLGCILFSHIQAPEDECTFVIDDVKAFPSYKKVIGYRKHLIGALKKQRTRLFLFYDAGWVDFMNVVGADFNFEGFAGSSYAALRMGEQFPTRAESWVRVITAKDLSDFVNKLRGDRLGEEALRWRRFFVSDQKRMLYDCSKVVEAMLRLRTFSSSVPVLRIDLDVLDALVEQQERQEQKEAGIDVTPPSQTGPNGKIGARWLAHMLDRAKKNHRHCVESPDVLSFVFSGGYRDEGERDTPLPQGFIDWATAYSTRVYPALLAKKSLLEHSAQDEPLSDFATTVTESGAFDVDVAKRFYGLVSKGASGVIRYGAHPRKAVISGSDRKSVV